MDIIILWCLGTVWYFELVLVKQTLIKYFSEAQIGVAGGRAGQQGEAGEAELVKTYRNTESKICRYVLKYKYMGVVSV